MYIGIDLGATKIESVVIEKDGSELQRNRVDSPKNYHKTREAITNIVNDIEKKYKNEIIWEKIKDNSNSFLINK